MLCVFLRLLNLLLKRAYPVIPSEYSKSRNRRLRTPFVFREACPEPVRTGTGGLVEWEARVEKSCSMFKRYFCKGDRFLGAFTLRINLLEISVQKRVCCRSFGSLCSLRMTALYEKWVCYQVIISTINYTSFIDKVTRPRFASISMIFTRTCCCNETTSAGSLTKRLAN